MKKNEKMTLEDALNINSSTKMDEPDKMDELLEKITSLEQEIALKKEKAEVKNNRDNFTNPSNFNEMLELFKAFGSIYGSAFKTVAAAQESGLQRGIEIGRLQANYAESERRATDAEDSFDELLSVVKKAREEGEPIDKLTALLERGLEVFEARRTKV